MAAPSGIEIGRLEPGDIRRAVLLLAQAMRDNPTHVKAFGGADREQRLCRFLAVMVDHVRTNGLLFGAWAEGRLVGVAGTLRPGACRPSLPDRISLALAILRRMPPPVAIRVLWWLFIWSRHHPAESHWHIGPVAVDPEWRRRGIGRGLMLRIVELAAEDSALAWLETDLEENLAFYRRLGFILIAERRVLGIRHWFMERRGGKGRVA